MNPQMQPDASFDENERGALRAQLLDRRQQLAQLSGTQLRAELGSLLAEVDSALARLDGPDFGLCTRCHGKVELERLHADPTTTICLDCLDQSQRRALERDLESAWRVQSSLLPPEDFQISDWQGHRLYHPYGAVSGDYIDVVTMNDGQSALVLLGDVSGKGVAAALLMSQLHALFRASAHLPVPLTEIVGQASRSLCFASPSNSFATLVAAHIQPEGRVVMVNAGHPAPILIGPRGVHELGVTGLPLGMFCDVRYTAQTLHLQPGEALLLYSDGLSESHGPDEREFGDAGILSALETGKWCCAADLVECVAEAAHHHRRGRSPGDDLSILAVARHPTGPSS